MKFQKKIIFVYMIFSVVITGAFGCIYYKLSVEQYKSKEYGNLHTVSSVKLQQMEDVLESMDAAITYFLSDIEILDSLKAFAALDSESYADIYFDGAGSKIRMKLSSYYLMDQFYRIVVFNKQGGVISNTNYTNLLPDPDASYDTWPWAGEVSGKKGQNVILGLHRDDWGNQVKPWVVSVAKEIQGMDMGYIEVQQSREKLDEIFGGEVGDRTYIFLTGQGEVLYQSDDSLDVPWYIERMEGEGEEIVSFKDQGGKKVLCLRCKSQAEDMVLLTVARTDISKSAMGSAFPVSLVLLSSMLLFSLGYVYVTSRHLARPVRQLQKYMESTSMENLEAEIPEKISNDEIEVLYKAYRHVLERLQESMVKEKRMSMLQLQAQFDLLQAQVNPHFIYNVLNVISGRGMLSDDEVICDMCAQLASMLRYATNTREKYAKVRDEVQYLEQYLGLLKHRYDYRLCYSINIDEKILDKILPKIILQQFAENSIVHGYECGEDIIEITLIGKKTACGWYLHIHDNGGGISKEAVDKVMKEIEEVKRRLTDRRTHVELDIGGMGLVNTYARLYLLYNEELMFEIQPGRGGGTEIIVGVTEEEEGCTEY